jgi:signal transduction histidine kinase
MRVGIKTKQVAGVTSIVGLAVIALSVMHLAELARVNLQEERARGELLANLIYQRAREVVASGSDPHRALREDGGLRSILESSLYSKDVIYAAIVDVNGVAVAHSDRGVEGTELPPRGELSELMALSSLERLRALYSDQGRTLELRVRLLLDSAEFGSIRVGVSTLLVRGELDSALEPAAWTAGAALIVATAVAMLLAQVLLRPIHVIRSGLTRLGQGEFGVKLDLPQQDEFGELGHFFNAVSAQLSADRSALAGEKASLESVVERLEDAVAVVNAKGELLFANPAMRTLLPIAEPGRRLDQVIASRHPIAQLVDETLVSRSSRGPVAITHSGQADEAPAELLVMSHAIADPDGRLVGAMLIARNLAYLDQVQSTLNYSRKLVALGRLSAGVAHEVKNPLNAMMIHLELLRTKLTGQGLRRPAMALAGHASSPVAALDSPPAAAVDVPAAMEHVEVIADEIRRLDQVVQGFLRFTRPEDLRLQPVDTPSLLQEVLQLVKAEADKSGVAVVLDCPPDTPDINADPQMLRQAFLNLALNACQAMPAGGTLRLACGPARSNRVEVRIEDTGVGIKPEHLEKIFDLYFTTKPHGSGIGLSMVYRIVQLHDGDVEVESTPGRGATFRVLLPRA